MMKWGRKKPSSASSSSRPHLISHVFPLTWLSKFKQSSNDKPDSGLSKSSQKGKQNDSLKLNPKSPSYKYCPAAYRDSSRFYTQDNDGFWRLSFGDQGGMIMDHQGHVDGDESCTKVAVPPRYCGDCRSNVKETAAKKKSPKLSRKLNGVSEPGELERSESLKRTYRRIIEATSELQRELDEVKDGYRKSVEKDLPELELLQVMQMMGGSNPRKEKRASARESGSFYQHKQKDDEILQALQLEQAKYDWQQKKDDKIKEVLSKNEKQRKSIHIGGDSQIRGSPKQVKVRSVRSPRTPSKTETCKIRAIENLKKAKMKKKMKEMVLDEKAANLESFAVVKCSRNPQQDFRESMIEMIMEKRIRRPEELEELLACYLTLNADEYHDLIIKVFRQVWCELEEAYFNRKISEDHYFGA